MIKDDHKNFLVISLGYLGDTLLVEPMCQNIRNNFPDSKIICIVSQPFIDLIRGFKSVDKIYPCDKKNTHKGIFGYYKFLREFKEENIDYAIITHPHERSIIIAKLTGAKNIISLPAKNSPLNIFINHKRKYIENEIRNTYKAIYNNGYLNNICETESLPVNYERNDIDSKFILDKFNLPDEYITLSPVAKDLVKDWDYEDIKNFINNLNKPVVLVGTDKASEIARKLKQDGVNFIDLSLETDVSELGVVIKNSNYCVSADTGTLHFAYAQGVKTVGLFFDKKMVIEWAPTNIDNLKILTGEKFMENKKVFCTQNIAAKEVIDCVVNWR